jgi:hypothetical protein
MNSIQPPRAWQLAAVSRMGRVTAFALVALGVDAVLARAAFPSAWIVGAIAAVSLLVAIRVARGFRHSLGAAAATFIGAGGIGLALSARSLVPVAILGVVTTLLAVQRDASTPTIELTRTNRDGPEPVTIRRYG